MSKAGTSGSSPIVIRRFVQVGARAVHCRITGHGPPALFVHSSPANSSFVVAEMAVVADRYTCFAFDTPGFGHSDPLPGDVLTVPDIADALAATLDAVGMPPVPVFGTHTGAAIALELGVRHPARVTGLVLDGLPGFTPEEYARLFADYTPDWPIDPLGGHFSRTWTRFRDQSTWFPWTARSPEAINESDLATPEMTHAWTTMFFDCMATYKPAYRAALSYHDAVPRLAGLTVPVILTAVDSDMLHPHLARFAPVVPAGAIRDVGPSHDARRALTADGLAQFGSPGTAPVLPATAAKSTRIRRQFVDSEGGQLLMRSIGDPARPCLLLVHDLPGGAGDHAARMDALAGDYFVVAFDLPGCGESTADSADVATVAARLIAACAAASVTPATAYGIGFGASVAVEAAALAGIPVLVEGLLLADAATREQLRACYSPPIAIEPDGGHWFRTWQMLRDGNTWWPWFDRRRATLRRVPADYGAQRLHDRTREVLRQPARYAEMLHAILDHDAAATLAASGIRAIAVSGSPSPVATAYDEALAQLPGVERRAFEELDPIR